MKSKTIIIDEYKINVSVFGYRNRKVYCEIIDNKGLIVSYGEMEIITSYSTKTMNLSFDLLKYGAFFDIPDIELIKYSHVLLSLIEKIRIFKTANKLDLQLALEEWGFVGMRFIMEMIYYFDYIYSMQLKSNPDYRQGHNILICDYNDLFNNNLTYLCYLYSYAEIINMNIDDYIKFEKKGDRINLILKNEFIPKYVELSGYHDSGIPILKWLK